MFFFLLTRLDLGRILDQSCFYYYLLFIFYYVAALMHGGKKIIPFISLLMRLKTIARKTLILDFQKPKMVNLMLRN